jgi:(R,R)-butanediol dehydrogenase/meso-butanediol dehydrogenase/diacetyl reductase
MRAVPVGDSIGMGQHGRLGGYADWLTVSAESLVRVPDRVSSRDAVIAEPMGNGLHFVRRGRLQPGQRVAILGAGQIGLSILYWARRLGAGRIVVSEPAPRRAAMAAALGADVVIDPLRCDDLVAAVADALGGRPHIVFEAAGRGDVMRQAMRLPGGGGAVVVLAGITLDDVPIRPVSLALKETDLVFPLGTVRSEVEEVLEVLARGELPVETFVSHRIGQGEAPAALRDLGRPTDQVKVVIEYPAGAAA